MLLKAFSFAAFLLSLGNASFLRASNNKHIEVQDVAPIQVVDTWRAKTGVPEDIQPFEIRLYNNAAWSNPYIVTNIDKKPMETMNTFPTAYKNWATVVAYNLPVGYVVSLVEDTVITGTTFTGKDYDFENQLRWQESIDLIGTGKPEAKTLDTLNSATTNAWCMYQYDPNLGFVEAFTDINFGGMRVVFFPSRFSFNTLIPFKAETFNWFIDNRIKSFRWDQLDSPVYFSFYRNYDAGGAVLYDVNGRLYSQSGTKSIADLSVYEGVSATLSALKWSMAAPLSIKSAALTIPDYNVLKAKSLSKSMYVTVIEGAQTDATVSLEQSWVQRSSTTTTTSTTKAWSFGVSFTQEVSYNGLAASCSASLTVSYDQSTSTTEENSSTNEKEETIDINEQHTVTLTEPGKYLIKAAVDIMDVEPVLVRFPVTKTYDFQVPRGTQVNGSNIWERQEIIPLTVTGNFRSESDLSIVKISN